LLALLAAGPATAQCTGCPRASFAGAGSFILPGYTALAVGDFNGDGIPDLVLLANSSTATLEIALGDGTGRFLGQPAVQIPSFVTQAVVGDFNGDGKPDVALLWNNAFVSPPLAGQVAVLFGDGTGNLSAPILTLTGGNPSQFAAADITGDGKLDLIIGQGTSLQVLVGDGAGHFSTGATIDTGNYVRGLAIGDLNNDGIPDVVASIDKATVAALGTGGGSFGTLTIVQESPSYTVGSSGVFLADFNQDGKLDLLVGNSLFLGMGNGSFQNPFVFNGTGFLLVADLNGDGVPDAVATTQSTGNLQILLGDGLGSFRIGGSVPGASFIADFNGDGIPDILSTGSAGNPPIGVSIYWGTGGGTFAQPPEYPVGPFIGSVVTGDFNKDGVKDIVASTSSPDSLVFLPGSGAGTFGAPVVSSSVGFVRSLAVGDFDEDGNLDVIAAATSDSVYLFRGDGTGHFGPPIPISIQHVSIEIVVADFNGDHHLDFAVVSDFGIEVRYGNGLGGFGPATLLVPSGFDAHGLKTADFNHDGLPDLFIVDSDGVSRVFLSKGAAGFSAPVATQLQFLSSLVIADFNGDSIPDLAMGSGVTVYLGDGSGSFHKSFSWSGDNLAEVAAAGDFNGDGHPDLAIATNGGIAFLMGDGAGSFQQRNGIAVPGPIALADDLNGDGKPDLVGIANFTNGNIWVALNTNCEVRRLEAAPVAASCGIAGSPLPNQPAVSAYDDGGNKVTCAIGDVTASLLPGSGTPGAALSGTTAVPFTAGTASFTNLSVDLPGRGYRLQFSSPQLTSTLGQPFSQSLPAPMVPLPSPVCTGIPQAIQAAGGYDSYQWSLDGVVIGTKSSIVLSGLSAGSHTLALTVIQNGCQATTTVPFSAQAGPSSPVASNNGPVPFGQTLQLTASTIPGASYHWTGPNGFTSNAQNPVVSPASRAASGTYQVVATVGGCDSPPGSTTVTVLFPPLCPGCANASFGPAAKAIDVGSLASGGSILARDFNLDGKPDLVVASTYPGGLTFYPGDGRGGFGPGVSTPFPANSQLLAAADFNGDGVPDLVASTVNALVISAGNPAGTFSAPTSILATSGPVAVAVGDFNGDGKPDLAVATSNTVTVLLGDGMGGFSTASTIAVDSPAAIVAADFNTDGKQDLAVLAGASASVLLFYGHGNGTFDSPLITPIGDSPKSLAVANLDGNALPDLVVVTLDVYLSGKISLLGGSVAGFSNVRSFPAPFISVQVADINGDGIPDLIGSGSFLLGRGNFAFDAPRPLPYATYYVGFDIADLNLDGIPDIAILSSGLSGSSSVFIVEGSADGPQLAPKALLGAEPSYFALADLNHDGRKDLVVSDWGAGAVSVLLARADGMFGSPNQVGPAVAAGPLAVGDFNQDGSPDLVVSSGANLLIFPGNGSGGFGPAASFLVGIGNTTALLVDDFNGDGKPDVVVANWGSLIFAPGDGAGGLGTPTTIGTSAYLLAEGDFNSDGKPDLILINGSVSVALGNGDGTFATPVPIVPSGATGAVAVGDVDEDGKLDLLVAVGSTIQLLRGNGSGGFAAPIVVAPVFATALVLADFNGDGHLDIAYLSNNERVAFLIGDGHGAFSASSTQYLSLQSPTMLAATDLDGDGRIDLIALSSVQIEAALLFNTNCEPRRLSVSTQPYACGAPGTPLPTQPAITVLDDGANAVACASGTVTASIAAGTGPPGAVLGGTTTAAEVSGVATFTNLSLDQAGHGYRLRFDNPLTRPAYTVPFSAGGSPFTVSITGPPSFCAGEAVVFDSGVPLADSAIWSIDGAPYGAGSQLHMAGITAGSHTLQVTVSKDGCSASNSIGIFAMAPTISAIVPPAGPIGGGTAVVLSGTCFVAGSSLTFGGNPAAGLTVDNNTKIEAVTPFRSTTGPVDVTVTNPGGSQATLPGGFTYLNPPWIFQIVPNPGPTTGGVRLTITGLYFTPDIAVSFDGIPATDIVVTSSTLLTATLPPHPAGTVEVTAAGIGGTFGPYPIYQYADLAARTFVSARIGNDINSCSISQPCRTLARAIASTAAGGEVVIRDSGGYGPFQADRAIAVVAPPGIYVGVTSTGGDAITVTAPPAAAVSLRGLSISGPSGTKGIRFATGGSLTVEDCLIWGFTNGVQADASSPLTVRNSTLRGAAQAGIVIPASNTSRIGILDSRFERNDTGLSVSGAASVAVDECEFAGNGSTGALAAAGDLTASHCAFVGNGTGISALGTAQVRLNDSMVCDNATGLAQAGGAVVASLGDNTVEGNGTNTVGTIGSYSPK
jgi:hypothetical protein